MYHPNKPSLIGALELFLFFHAMGIIYIFHIYICIYINIYVYIYILIGGLEHEFYFSIYIYINILGMIIPTDEVHHFSGIGNHQSVHACGQGCP